MYPFKIYECAYCGDEATENDHVTPRSRGGRLTVPSCAPCNRSKSRKDADEWLAHQLIRDARCDIGDDASRRLVEMLLRLPALVDAGIIDMGCVGVELASAREEALQLALNLELALTTLNAAVENARALAS
ncbi:MAG: endonuclease [Thermomicrobiales bacterium]|jgi:hypothetical protein|nr:endonuclease [Thermomicrobiales bacterium]MDF3014797.1 endonuclease [Thermomicrobiales bacterium]